MRTPLLSCLRSVTVWLTLACFVVTQAGAQSPAPSAAHDQGLAAGQAVQPVVRGGLNASDAAAVVPGYTATPPERLHYGQPSLSGPGNARLAACALTPADPVCQALLGAQTSAQTPRAPISPYDPAVLGARRVAAHPGATLENLGSFYSGCQVDTVPTAATETRVCRQGAGVSGVSCARSLTVDVARSSSCAPGIWFTLAGAQDVALAVQCRPDQQVQRVRATDRHGAPQFFDLEVGAARVFPQPVQTLAPRVWWEIPRAVWIVDDVCTGNECRMTGFLAEPVRRTCRSQGDAPEVCTEERPFLETYATCPAGTQSGDRIVVVATVDPEGGVPPATTLEAGQCYAPSSRTHGIAGQDTSGAFAAAFWQPQASRAIVGYAQNPRYGTNPALALHFTRPHTTVTQTDRWDDACPALAAEGRCSVAAAARCVEGPATRSIDGVPVTRDCWRYATALSCGSGAATDECAPLAAAGCTPAGSVCRQTDPATGACTLTEASYTCPVAPATTATATNCPTNVFCVAGSCFNTTHTADPDFARAMSFLEAAREAGVYLDTDLLQVFKGEPNRCRDRLLKNCCSTDSAGRGMHNQSLFGVGSRMVYDVLMNASNRAFLYQGMQALLLSGGFSGSFTSFGVTVAINGTALPAGSAVLYAGESMVVAFDPWSLVIAIVIYVVMSAIACDAQEGQLTMKEGARLCHAVGTYCSSCIRVLGRCVSCTTHTTNKCCFNSALARIVQEQGRQQIGKGWGTARNPDCSGFTIAQLQSLDFARMDLSEFYASIVPTLPNAATVQSGNVLKAGSCYYGEGRCP